MRTGERRGESGESLTAGNTSELAHQATAEAGNVDSLSAAYLSQIAKLLEPGWKQFLSDCRQRLPAGHALNQMQLAATVDLAIDAGGKVDVTFHTRSGNADFDRAVRDAIRDSAPLTTPPFELISDDNRVHLRWLFARDRRRAGPETARVTRIELPLTAAVTELIHAGSLTRAARRIAADPHDPMRDAATTQLMRAALQQAIRSADGTVQRAAVHAIAQARVAELASDVRALLTVAIEPQLRLAALHAAGELDDTEAVAAILLQLPKDMETSPELARAATRALARLGRADDAAKALRYALTDNDPNLVALEAFANAPLSALPKLDTWFKLGNPRVRAAICSALPGAPAAQALQRLRKGLADRDATVRATCATAAAHVAASNTGRDAQLVRSIRKLARDPDRAVRASAIRALATLDPMHRVDATADPAAEVRAAYASAPSITDASLRTLIEDRDADVRAAAWTTVTSTRPGFPQRAPLARLALADPAPQVRLAVLASLNDDAELTRVADSDDAPELRTAALVELARRRGRPQSLDMLLDRFALAPANSVERVRAAIAWLNAR